MCTHCFIVFAMHLSDIRSWTNNNNNNNKKSNKKQMKQKGKLKYIKGTWGHKNEVIQVQCVEIKLKVNNNKKKPTTQGDERDEVQGQKPQRTSRFILSSYWSPPKLLAVSRQISDLHLLPPTIWICHQPDNAVTCSDIHHNPLGSTIIPDCIYHKGLMLHFKENQTLPTRRNCRSRSFPSYAFPKRSNVSVAA